MINGPTIRLRVLELDDAKALKEHYNDLELRIFLANRLPKALEDEIEFIKRSWKFNKIGNLTLGIEQKKDKRLIGTIGCWETWKFSNSYELGIAIWEPQFQSKGYGTEAMYLLLFYIFEIINAHRVQLLVLAYNSRARASYKKVGFKEVGCFREADHLFGKYHDVYIMDLLKDEFEANAPDYIGNLKDQFVKLTS